MSHISHIGIAVENLDQAVKIYSRILDGPPPEVKEVPDQKVKVAIFAPGDDAPAGCIELLEGIGDNSPIRKFISKRGPGLHHIAVKVANIEKKLEDLRAEGFQLIDQKPRIGARGKKIAFLHPSSTEGVLLELEE